MKKNNFVNKAFFLENEYSEVVVAEHFKISGDKILEEYPVVGLYMYRHFIELQLKSLLKRFKVEYDFNHDMKKLLELLNKNIEDLNILTKKDSDFLNEIVLDYIDLDERGTSLRYPNFKDNENLITNEKFINKNIINGRDNPIYYLLKEEEVRENIKKLFKVLFKIHDFIEGEKRGKEIEENYYQS